MAAPLIVAGAKVAGKAIAKKLAQKAAAKAAQKGAQVAAKKVGQKAGEQLVKKGTEKAVKTSANKLTQAKNIYNKVEKARDIKDQLAPQKKEREEKEPPRKNRWFIDRFLPPEQAKKDREKINIKKEDAPKKINWLKTFEIDKSDKTVNANEQPADSKFTFYAAMFVAIVKDGIEIALTMALMVWLIPILTFLPTVLLTTILFLSGKKGLMKIVMYLIALFVDFFVPGINVLPITTLAVFITFKLTPKAKVNVNSKNINKGLNIIKSFIK